MATVPPGTQSLRFKVGAGVWPTFGDGDIMDEFGDSLAIVFEPDPVSSYKLMNIVKSYARGVVWVLPVAVANVGPGIEQMAGFHRYLDRGPVGSALNSLLPGVGMDWLGVRAGSLQVPVVSLYEILRRLPGLPVVRLSIDAQGADLEVALSAARELHRIGIVSLELRSLESKTGGYIGQAPKTEVIEALKLHGFELQECHRVSGGWHDEEDCLFSNSMELD